MELPPPPSSAPSPTPPSSADAARTHDPHGPRSHALRVSLILGLVALPLGLWLFLESQGVGVPEMSRWWPTILLLIALGLAIDFFALSRRPRSAGLAVLYLGIGCVLYGFTLGRNSWQHTLDRLPAVPLVIGAALIAHWLADGRRGGAMIAAGAGFAVLGLAGLAARLPLLEDLLPRVQELWALALLLVGGVLLWKVVRHLRGGAP